MLPPDYEPSEEILRFVEWSKGKPTSVVMTELRKLIGARISDEELASDRANELLARMDRIEQEGKELESE